MRFVEQGSSINHGRFRTIQTALDPKNNEHTQLVKDALAMLDNLTTDIPVGTRQIAVSNILASLWMKRLLQDHFRKHG
jgi:hypothetical protein